MIHNIDAIYDNGVLRPVEPLALPEGARVHLRVEDENGSPVKPADYNAWLDSLAGRWQGEFVRGSEGDFETREPLS
jgi:predicted DNA-binding antitoxin AbrB/MazE fold protein